MFYKIHLCLSLPKDVFCFHVYVCVYVCIDIGMYVWVPMKDKRG